MTNVPLTYEQLTDAERAWMLNGCGPGNFWGKLVPEMIYHAACNRHDFDYWSGLGPRDRYLADRRFLMNMFAAADVCAALYGGFWSWWLKNYYHAWARRYYVAVRVLGKKRFAFRDHYGTRADLAREMAADPRLTA
jgi:hypothetical protein